MHVCIHVSEWLYVCMSVCTCLYVRVCVRVCLRGVWLYLCSECIKFMEGITGTMRVQVSNHFSSAISMNINEVKVRLTLTFCRHQPFLVCDTVSVALLPAVILSSGELCLLCGCGVVMLLSLPLLR